MIIYECLKYWEERGENKKFIEENIQNEIILEPWKHQTVIDIDKGKKDKEKQQKINQKRNNTVSNMYKLLEKIFVKQVNKEKNFTEAQTGDGTNKKTLFTNKYFIQQRIYQ